MWIWPEGGAYIANYSWMEKSVVVSGFSPHYLWLGLLQLCKSQMSQWKRTNYILPLRKICPFSCTKCWGKYIMLREDCSYGSLIFQWNQYFDERSPKTKTAINITSIRVGSISVTNHFPVRRVTTWTMEKICWYSEAAQRVKFHFPTRKENLGLCLGNTWLIFGQDL